MLFQYIERIKKQRLANETKILNVCVLNVPSIYYAESEILHELKQKLEKKGNIAI